MNELLTALSEFTSTEAAPLFYRLYYDPLTGRGLFMSMEDVEGTWVEISKKEYDELRLDYIQVRDGKIIEMDGTISRHRLWPGTPEVYRVHAEEHMLPCTGPNSIPLTRI